MVDHLNKWFPEECQTLGEKEVRRRIRDGIDRADGYGIVGRRDVIKFIDVAFALGPAFDEDPNLPWAGRILRNDRIGPSQKVDELVDAALEHRRAAPEQRDQ
jgi:hypothetical protein